MWVSKYVKYADELDFTGIDFPMQLKNILRFENQNDTTVNVFGYEKGSVYPLQLTKKRFMCLVDLLVISNGNRFLLDKTIQPFDKRWSAW